MINNKLSKPVKIQFTNDQTSALCILKSKGISKQKFIRPAVDEKLYRDFRVILKNLKVKEETKNYPNFMFD